MNKQEKPQPLRETVRQYPSREGLSNEATQLFTRTFQEQSKASSAQKAFAAAKKAVDNLPKERRYRSDSDTVTES